MESDTSWKARTLFVGALVGAVTGIGAAYLLVRRAEQDQDTPMLTTGDGISLGLLVLGLLRQIARLGTDD
jgi:hypothetical protein